MMAERERWPATALPYALRGPTVVEPTADGEGHDDLRLLLDDGTVCVILEAAVTDATLGPDLPLPPYGELQAYIGGRELWPFDDLPDGDRMGGPAARRSDASRDQDLEAVARRRDRGSGGGIGGTTWAARRAAGRNGASAIFSPPEPVRGT